LTGNLTQRHLVDLAVNEHGFVLSGGKLDPLLFKIEDGLVTFRLTNDANVLEGKGKIIGNNHIEGDMKVGRIDGELVEGRFTLELESPDTSKSGRPSRPR
jgi:hypothetical protein